MTTQYTPILKLALPVQGELSGTWGDVVNDNITSMVEQAIAGLSVVNTWTTNSHVLTTANGTTAESRAAMLSLTDSGTALTGAGSVICPALSKVYIVKNGTAQVITVKTAAGSGIAVPVGKTMLVYCDGTNVLEAVDHIVTLSAGTLTITGLTTFASLKGTGAVTVTNILDEDNMASDSATALATQQSIKAYVDSQVGTVDTLSEILAIGNTSGANNLIIDNGQAITTNTINETTAASGVTIDSVLLKDDGVNATNLEITNLKANDGTSAGSIADSTGVVTLASSVLTTADINGGTIDGTTLGATTPSSVAATTGSFSSTLGVTGAATFSSTVAGAFNGTLGATTPASVAATTLSTTGDISLPDGAKAIFGAGSDLQIFHDGSNSYIQSTTGNLNFTTAGGAEFAVTAANNGAVTLFHDGSTKLATTATGIDVTGTVTADGLDVDTGDAGNGLNYGFDVKNAASGSATSYAMPAISWSNGGLRWASVHGERNPAGGYGGSFVVNTMNSSGSAVKRLGIDSGGDISFYEDTGTTAKFFWDASAESLGIGTSSPVSKLQVRNDSDTDYNPSTAAFNTILTLQNNTSGASNNALLSFTTESNGEWYIGGVQNSGNTAADFVFASRASGARAERMRIDASGNVGLGVVPSAWGSYYSTINAGSAGNLSFFTGQTNAPVANVGVNLYNDNTNFRYAATGAASFYQQYVGEHRWYNVASGGVGDIATPVQAMTLDASGDLTTTGAATFGGNVTGKNATFVTTTAASLISIGDTAAGTYSLLRMYGGSGKYNFQVGVQNNVNNAFEITPSTALGGTTFTTPALLIDGTTGAATFSSTLSVGNIATFTNDNQYLVFNRPTTGDFAYIGTASNTTGGSATDLGIRAENNLILGAGGYGADLTIATTGAATFGGTVDSKGQMIIRRTTSPNEQLRLASEDGIVSITAYNGVSTDRVAIHFVQDTTGTDYTPMVIDASGSVGIGVVPIAHHYKSLEIGNAGSQITGRTEADTYFMSGLYWSSSSTIKYAVSSVPVGYYNITNGAHSWNNSAAGTAGNDATINTAMTLDASGNLLVGASSTGEAHILQSSGASKLTLSVTNANATTPYGQKINFSAAAPNDATYYFLTCADTSATRATIRSNGGLANYSANDANLSDEREKNQFGLLGSTTACLREWEIVKYLYKDEDQTLDPKYGVIAQQVAPHCPEVITDWVKVKGVDEVLWTDEDELPEGVAVGDVKTAAVQQVDRIGVKEQQMFWMLVKSHQEALDTIDALTARIEALEGAK
jgi:hypothetical protein